MITAYLVDKQVCNFWECVQAILLVTTVAVMQSGHPCELVLLALTNALEQVLTYYAIKQYGTLIFQWIMTTRRVLSVVCSSLSGTPSLQEKRCVSYLSLVCLCTRRLLQGRRKARI